MPRRYKYYDFNTPNKPVWVTISFPGADRMNIPNDTGIYRFVRHHDGENQTMFTDIAPSSYGPTLRSCYTHHVSIRNDQLASLYQLYIMGGIEFEHCQCNEKKAKEHKHSLVSNFKPHFNTIIELKITNKSNKGPFDN